LFPRRPLFVQYGLKKYTHIHRFWVYLMVYLVTPKK